MKQKLLSIISCFCFGLQALYRYIIAMNDQMYFLDCVYMCAFTLLAIYCVYNKERYKGLMWGALLYAIYNTADLIYRHNISSALIFIGSALLLMMLYNLYKGNSETLKKYIYFPGLLIFTGMVLMNLYYIDSLAIYEYISLLEPVGVYLLCLYLNMICE